MPPVTITEFQHSCVLCGITGGQARDEYKNYTGSPFSATIGSGDVLRIRIEAPPGKKFVVHTPASFDPNPGYFDLHFLWSAPTNDIDSTPEPDAVSFESFQGTAPNLTYSFVELSDQAYRFEVTRSYRFSAAFEFTAIRAEIGPVNILPGASRTYSSYTHELLVQGASTTPNSPIIEIVDVATPALHSTWGRVKSIYR